MKWLHWRFVNLTMAKRHPLDHAWDLGRKDGYDDIPDEPGVYVLGTGTDKLEHYTDCTMFAYPWGTSPIYYIGAAEESVRAQLKEDASEIRTAKLLCGEGSRNGNDFKQYGAAYGAMAVWFILRRNDDCDDDCEHLLRSLFECFHRAYGAIPVANSNGDCPLWPTPARIRKSQTKSHTSIGPYRDRFLGEEIAY